MPYTRDRELYKNELNEYLLQFDEYCDLSVDEREMAIEHFEHPEWSKTEIARKLGWSLGKVSKCFMQSKFQALSERFANAWKNELRLRALKVYEDLLSSEDERVKQRVAKDFLTDSGMLKTQGSTVLKQDNRIQVAWQSSAPPPIEKIKKLSREGDSK